MAKRKEIHRSSSTDASASALGYLYQSRYSLLLALQKEEGNTLNVVIEKLDDVSFTQDDGTPAELLQFKHVLKRSGKLGDKSADIWNTLKYWSEKVKNEALDLSSVSLNFVTTSTATEQNAIRFLRPLSSVRDPKNALAEFLKAGKSSSSLIVNAGYAALTGLTPKTQLKLFEAITLLEGSADILEARTKIEDELRVVRKEHRKGFVDRLEGWWFRFVVEQLMNASKTPLTTELLWDTIYDLQSQFQRDNLPVDMLDTIIPPEELPDKDERLFVRQLRLIGISQDRTRMAQEDYYRAYEQRSRWIRDNLIDLNEFERFNNRLIDGWRQRFEIIREEVQPEHAEELTQSAGRKVYDWTQLDATSDHNLVIRPQVQGAYIIRGSYHMLADRKHVGWHPHFEERLIPETGSQAETEENHDVDDVA